MPNPYDLGPEGMRHIRESVYGKPEDDSPRCTAKLKPSNMQCQERGEYEVKPCDSCGKNVCEDHRRDYQDTTLCDDCDSKHAGAKQVAREDINDLMVQWNRLTAEDLAQRLLDISNKLSLWDAEVKQQ